MRPRQFGTFPSWFLAAALLLALVSGYLRWRYEVWLVERILEARR